MDLTNDILKDMATSCVAQFVSEQTPLNNSITKIASDSELNPDQIKRVVEATNQLAYLSKLASADDRTAEFPIAEYSAVMGSMFDDIKTIDKQASVVSTISDIFMDPIEKTASTKEWSVESYTTGEKMLALQKSAAVNRRIIDDMKLAERDILTKIAQQVEIVRRDTNALEKIASLDNSLELTRLVFGHDKVATTLNAFSDAALSDLKYLSETLGMAKEASATLAALEPKVLKAEELIKEASLGSMMGALRNIGAKLPTPVRNAATKVGGKLKKPIAVAGTAIGVAETADNINNTSKNTKRKSDAWSSLRG